MIQLGNNLRLSLSTVAEHLGDDPVVLILQIIRRLPERAVHPLANGLYVLLSRRRISFVAILASYTSGRRKETGLHLQRAVTESVSGWRARWLSDIALATGEPELAHKLLAGAGDNAPGIAGTVARILWYHGDMSAAVAALYGAQGAEYRQKERLSSELKVFRGWSPRIAAGNFRPVDGRVLHVLTNSLPHTASGYAQRSHSILSAQRDRGWDLKAVTRVGYPVQVGKLLAHETDIVDGIEYQRLIPPNLMPGMDGRLQQQTEALARIVENFRPSVIHTTSHFVNGLVVREVARKYGIPWVYEVRGQLADTWASVRNSRAFQSERYKMFQAREAEVMRSADLVVTLGDAMRQELRRKGVAMEDILIVPNAIGESFLSEPSTSLDARRKVGLDPHGLWVGTVSSLVDYEGIDYLLSAFAILAPRYPELKVLIVGEGVSGPSLRRQAEELGLSDRVVFTGRVPRERTSAYHQALDVFVVPRRDTTVTQSVTPLKPVEAQASARPVVASRLAALTETIHHKVNGLIVEPGDPIQLAEALDKLLGDKLMRQRFGSAGRESVLAERTWSHDAKLYTDAYNRLVGSL